MTDKRVVVITGASGGIGGAIAARVAAADRCVVIHYRERKAEAQAVAERVASQGCEAKVIKADLTDPDQIEALFDAVQQWYGRGDVLVNNAGPSFSPTRFADLSWEEMERHLTAHVGGAFRCTKRALAMMTQHGGGHIVTVLSSFVLGLPPVQSAHYVTAKYALMGLMKSIGVEASKVGVRVNMVSPYLTRTEMLSGFSPRFLELLEQQHPLKRLAMPEDVASAVAYLLSDEARYLNLVNLPMTGGIVA